MTAGTTVRPGDLLAQPARFVGRRVRVDIVEPLEGGPEAPEQIASSEFGYYRVAVPDSGGGRLSLVAPAFRLQDAARYHAKFDRVLAPPLRVEGDFLDDTDNASSPDADHAYVLRVTRAEPLDLGAPVRITSVEALGTEGRYDRALVEIAGDVRRGFEVSAIEGKIWVSSAAYRDHALGRPSSPGSHVGILYARKGARFGHLGAYSYELIVPRND
jgi:hypothetical protein